MHRFFVVFPVVSAVFCAVSSGWAAWTPQYNLAPTFQATGAVPGLDFGPDGVLHAIIAPDNDGGSPKLHYRSMTGTIWSSPYNLPSPDFKEPGAMVKVDTNGIIHVVGIYRINSSGPYTVWYWRNQGGVWFGPEQVSAGVNECTSYSMALDKNNDLHVVWMEGNKTCGKGDIMYRKRQSGTWTASITNITSNCSPNTYGSDSPDIAVDLPPGNNVHVVWHDEFSGYPRVYYTRNTNLGDPSSWWPSSSWIQITQSNYGKAPSVRLDRNNVPNVWYVDNFGTSTKTCAYSRWTGSGFSVPWSWGNITFQDAKFDVNNLMHYVYANNDMNPIRMCYRTYNYSSFGAQEVVNPTTNLFKSDGAWMALDAQGYAHVAWQCREGEWPGVGRNYYSTNKPLGPPGPVTGFYVLPSDSLNRLYWTNPANLQFAGTMIRFKTTGFPTGPTDGILLADQATAPGATDSYTHSGLTNGQTYYYALFAHDTTPVYAAAATASGLPTATLTGNIKSLANNSQVDLTNKVVSAIYPTDNCIYIQELDRSSGIRVANSGSGLAVGDRVNVSGKIDTRVLNSIQAERYINLATVTKVSTGAAPVPMGVNCKTFGGADFLLQKGVKDGIGLNNIGLLVAVYGKVTYASGQYIFVDDGSNIENIWGLSTPTTGIMIKGPTSTTAYPAGSYVKAVGVAMGSVPNGWTENRRYMQVRDWNDVMLLAAAASGSIAGTVTDGANPVSGATVSTNTGGYTTTTNASGAYTLSNVTAGTYNVTATKAGYSSQTQSNVSVVNFQTSTVNFTINLTTGSIAGIVTDGSGSGVAGATVTTNTGGYSTTTGAGGVYTLSNVTAGTYTVSAAKTGYTGASQSNVSVSIGQTTTVNLQMIAQPGSISGTVTDGANPVSGATVTTNTGGYSATTSASGAYTIANVAAGTYNVTASKSGYSPATQNGVGVSPGQTVAGINLVLAPLPGSIAGTVTDGTNPVSGATVSTSSGGYTTTTNASGLYTLSNVAVGTYSVTASKSGFQSHAIDDVLVSSQSTTTVNFVLSNVPTEKVVNGNMESGFFNTGWATTCSGKTSQLPSPNTSWGWNNDTSYPFNTWNSTSIKRGGASALGFSFCQTAASPGKMGIASQGVYLGAPNATATFSVWSYHTNGNCPPIMCWNPGNNQNNPATAYTAGRYQWVCTDNWGQLNTWVNRTMTVTADSSGYVTIMVGGAAHPGTSNGAQLFIDDVSVL